MDGAASTRSRPGVARRPHGGDVVVLVNGAERSALGERGRWIGRAAGPAATVAYRTGGRRQAIASFVRRIRAERPRIVYLLDTAIATVVAGAWARRLGARVILDTGDATTALTRVTGRLGPLGHLGAPLLERVAYALAATVVVRSEELGRYVRSIADRPVVVVPDGFDPALVDTAGGERHRRRWGIADDRIVVGVLGSAHWNARRRWCYGRDVVEAVAAARRRDVVGAVLVRGDGLPRLHALAERLGVRDRVVFADPADGPAAWQQLAALDVALSTQTNDAVGRVRTTGKLVQYMAAGRFILASRVGAASALLPDAMLVDYDGAWDDGYFERLAQRVDTLDDRPSLAEQGGRLREPAERFAYPRLVLSLSTVFTGA
jgi:glycosyltransferase involved in cell wall biosynthesis